MGRLRFVSHRDMLLVFERALRRADLRVSHTEGFNPRPRLTFAQALPLGVESMDEVVDIDLVDDLEPAQVQERLAAALPPDLVARQCERAQGTKAPQPYGAVYRVEVGEAAASLALAKWQADKEPVVIREQKGRRREIPLRDYVRDLSNESGSLCFTLRFIEGAGMKPAELLEWLGLDPIRLRATKLRTLLVGEEQAPARDNA